MILLDTHIWIWLVQGDARLEPHRAEIEQHRQGGLGVSVFSCWEVAMLLAKSRIQLPYPAAQWIERARALPQLELLPLTPEILVLSIDLPEPFHKDPADRIIVATAILRNLPVLTDDRLILKYPHVRSV